MYVAIRYLVRGQTAPTTLSLEPSQYFEPLEPGASWEHDGVPRFDRARDYLPHALNLAWTELEVSTDGGVSRVREVTSPDGRVTHWHRADPDGYEELCISSQVSPNIVHIARLSHGHSEPWHLAFSSVITDLPDGSQSENLLYSRSRDPAV